MTATEYLVWGSVVHLVADWLLQNDWMAHHKADLTHAASIVHGAIHFAALGFVFWRHPWVWAALTAVHQLIDTRVPLSWWARAFRQTREGPAALHVAIWGDQVLHLACLAVAALICGGQKK